MSKYRAIILGCGSSAGIPRLGGEGGAGNWGDCDPHQPKNRRRRCSIIVQRACDAQGWEAKELTTLLIDTSPDLREQLLSARIGRVDAVAYTHDHADQCHGIDDLRALVLIQKKRIPAFIDRHTSPNLIPRFAYCFQDNDKTGYPAILQHQEISAGEEFSVDGPSGVIPVLPILFEHGPIMSLGFRFGEDGVQLAYSPDMNGIPAQSWPHLMGLEAWIIDALRYTEHPSHAHLEQSLGWLDKSAAKRGILTNLHVDLDYDTLKRETPDHIDPAFDGCVIEWGR